MTGAGRPYVVAAGGTGGHLFPARAVAEALSERGAEVALFTDERGRAYARDYSAGSIHVTRAATFAGKGIAGRVGALGPIFGGMMDAFSLMGRLGPAAVAGFGGYASGPAMMAAVMRGIPTLVHEQNAILGRTNRLLKPYVSSLGLSFPDTGRVDGDDRKAQIFGNPVRAAVEEFTAEPFVQPAPDARFELLVFGGSQGARIFGDVVPKALLALPEGLRRRVRLTAQIRDADESVLQADLSEAGIEAELAPFFDDLPRRMAKAHLVIGRAGASTVSELSVIGRPAVLVPLPIAMDDHQTRNASFLADRGGAWLVPQSEFTPDALAGKLEALFANPETLQTAARAALSETHLGAAARLADKLEALAAAKPVAAIKSAAASLATLGLVLPHLPGVTP
jgi:UDP-N-acetylglucosamine--N-acetylmuramyl-(pentapeptide) pyrophosphoryl-undecaprenol N-acetylglucosamine transferase